MANTRFNYTYCRTVKKLQESTYLGAYMLNTPGNGVIMDYQSDPYMLPQKFAANLMKDPIGVENALLGYNRPLNRDLVTKDQYKRFEAKTEPVVYPVSKTNWTEQSRATCPAWTFRDLPQDLWAFPPFNPQENTCLPFISYENTRIVEKDNFDRWGSCIRKI